MNPSLDHGDEEITKLVISAQSGDECALKELYRRYEHLLKSIAHGYSLDYDDDVSSKASDSFWRAVQSYDIGKKEVTFGLYAKICVKNAMIDCKKELQRRPRLTDDRDVDSIAVSDGVQQYLEMKEDYGRIKGRIKEILTELEYKVFELWSQKYKTAEISELLAIPPKSVDNAKARMWRRLREEFGSERKSN